MPIEMDTLNIVDIFEQIRESIYGSLLERGGWFTGSLAPVLIFLEDPETDCLYNWTNTKWEELKLSNSLRIVLIELIDIVITGFGTGDTQVRSLIKKLERFVHSEVSGFDNFLNKRFDNLCNDLKKIMTKLAPLLSDLPSSSRTKTYRVSPMEIPRFVSELTKISEGRRYAFEDLRDVIREYCDPSCCGKKEECYRENYDIDQCINDKCGRICYFIAKHPKFSGNNELANEAKEEWRQLAIELRGVKYDTIPNPNQEIDTDMILNRLFSVFNNLPQERDSSKAYKRLKQINQDEIKKRLDTDDIEIRDIAYFPSEVEYDIAEDVMKYDLYRYTHAFERVYYGGIKTGNRICIEHIIYIPVKFFDFQVRGQIVVISPREIYYSSVIDAIRQHYNKIQEAARTDFFSEILRNIITSYEDTLPFSLIFSEALARRLLNVQSIYVWENGLFRLCGIRLGEEELAESGTRLKPLRLFKEQYARERIWEKIGGSGDKYDSFVRELEGIKEKNRMIIIGSRGSTKEDDSSDIYLPIGDGIVKVTIPGSVGVVEKFRGKIEETLLFVNYLRSIRDKNIEHIRSTRLALSRHTRRPFKKACNELIDILRETFKDSQKEEVEKAIILKDRIFRILEAAEEGEPKDIEDVFRDVHKDLEITAKKKYIKLVFTNEVEEYKSQYVLVYMIVYNLVNNSIEHAFENLSDNRPRKIETSFTKDRYGRYVLRITDNGNGLPRWVEDSDMGGVKQGLQLGKGYGFMEVRFAREALGWGWTCKSEKNKGTTHIFVDLRL